MAKALGKRCAALRDNDDNDPSELIAELGDLVDDTTRKVFIGATSMGTTLEPQVVKANPDDALMRRVLGVTDRADLATWMTNDKTGAALRIAEATERLTAPTYFKEAIEFIRADA